MEHFFVGIVTLEAEGAIPPPRLSHLARLARLFLDHENRLPWSVFRLVLRAMAFVGGAA